MTDVTTLKEQCDLRKLVEEDLGPARCQGGRALLWRCPFHSEHKGYSLAVWQDGWRCFGACQASGDALDWLQRYRGLSFRQACEVLGAPRHPCLRRRVLTTPQPVSLIPEIQPPDEDWQQATRKVIAHAEGILWSEEGERARAYLKGRGLTEETMLRARLGYLPGQPWEWRQLEKLNVPCGILIPWVVGREIWAVKVRRAQGMPKYTQIAGGSPHGLYNAAGLEAYSTILFVEGEFDCLLAEQEAGGLVAVATLGSASSALHRHWLPLLALCRRVLVAYDNDEAGRKGAMRLHAITKRARVIHVPQGKDFTEFVLQGGNLRIWLSAYL